jgi:DNA primase
VEQYVELSASGVGLCPFHDDQHHSFSVNEREGYWHCFAGCGGGSVLDFYMRLQDVDFATAVRELADILL